MSPTLSGVSPQHPGELNEPIVAVASPQGRGLRAVVRLTGAGVWEIVRGLIASDEQPRLRYMRACVELRLALPGLHSPLPVHALLWPAPRTYTGQDLIELHTFSSQPIVDLLLAHLQGHGTRLARPGEFTLRAFLAGKLDLTQAEAVRAVIDAVEPEELHAALGQLAGGVSTPLRALRARLLHLLAEVEAGLDFAEEDLTFIGRTALLGGLREVEEQVQRLCNQLGQRAVAGRAFRVVLAGPPNAGKSSLFNALANREAALVSPEAGTTRDYLIQRLELGGMSIELVDTAGVAAFHEHGRQSAGLAADAAAGEPGAFDARARAAGAEQARSADLVLLCSVAEDEERIVHDSPAGLDCIRVVTKADLSSSSERLVGEADGVLTSAATGQGLGALTSRIVEHARKAPRRSALALSATRAQGHLDACLKRVATAREGIEQADSPELLALELRLALEQIGELVGEVCTEDLLDRVFSQFCIGK